MLPGAQDRTEYPPEQVDAIISTQLTSDAPPELIVLANKNFGLHHLYRGEEAGAYVNGKGQIVAEWSSKWERPEIWLFDLHHHLLAGEAGEWVAAIAALVGLGFVITGIILWWPTRATFSFRLWPRRMSRSAIVRQHRDLGIVFSPLLFFACLTGAMMLIKPFAALILWPLSSPDAMDAARKSPSVAASSTLASDLDWRAILSTARARFPDAQLRIVALPRAPGQPITIRMKQPSEWLPNGRSTLWFAPNTGRLIAVRDALSLPAGLQAYNILYTLHAGKVSGLVWTMLIALSGLALAMLGSFASWSFWFGGKRQR